MGIVGVEESFRFIQVAEGVKGMTLGTSAAHSILKKEKGFVGAEKNLNKQLSNDAAERITTWTDFIMP